MKKLRLALKLTEHLLFNTLTQDVGAISIDVTSRCNLRCKHCYLFSCPPSEIPPDLDDEALIARLKEIKEAHPNILSATWVGGEPLLRRDLIEEGKKIFPFNTVVTNGTMKLPKWRDVVMNVSIDGDRGTYKKVRGLDLFDKIMRNIEEGDAKVYVCCVLTRLNNHCVESLIAECRKNKNIGGIFFDFYTPIRGADDAIWLDWDERDETVHRLLELKKTSGDFIVNSKLMLTLMLAKNCQQVIGRNCPVKKLVVCVDSAGNIKKPCVIAKGDCGRCGCVIPYLMHASLRSKDFESLGVFKKYFV